MAAWRSTTPIQSERVVSVQTAFQMVSMLGDVIDRGTGSVVRRAGVTFPVGGKTGTTNDFKDAWFVGFSSNLVVGVWVGFDQPQTDRPRGLRVALCGAALDRLHAARRPYRARPRPSTRRSASRKRRSAASRICGRSRAVRPTPSISNPTTRCRAASARSTAGNIKQQVRRAIEGLLSGVGKKIRGIFR